MTVRKIILGASVLMMLAGCTKEFDYDAPVEPKIVVNAMLNPDSKIRIDLWNSKKTDGEAGFDRLDGAHVVLKEDGAVILDTHSDPATAVSLDYSPKPGASYSITVQAQGYAPVSASTTVPDAGTFSCRYVKTMQSRWYSTYRYYHIDGVALPANAHSAWVSVTQAPEPSFYDLPKEYTERLSRISSWGSRICTTAPFADQFNCEEDSSDAADKGSVKEYQGYLRVAPANANKVFPLTFSVYKELDLKLYPEDYDAHWGFDDQGNRVNLKYGDEGIRVIKMSQRVSLITTSKECDLYYKSLYQFSKSQEMNGLIIGSKRYSVYSNVKGGAGIFAAYNARCNELFDFHE